MKSQAKLFAVLALLFAVIFGITVISSSVPPVDPNAVDKPGGPGEAWESGPPLGSAVLEYKFDPKAPDDAYHQRLYPGFFEIGSGGSDGSRNWVAFVLRNLRPVPVKILALPPGCATCTLARAATVDPAALRDCAMLTAASQTFSLPGAPNPLASLAWAAIYAKLNWHVFDFGDPKSTLTIPAAGRDAAGTIVPQWLIVELDFRISSFSGPVPKKDTFQVFDAAGAKIGSPMTMIAVFGGCPPFDSFPAQMNVGEIAPGLPGRTVDLFTFSMSRDSFPPPTVVSATGDAGISIGTPVPMTADERETVAIRVVQEQYKGGGFARIRSGWRFPVTVLRQPPGAPPADIAEFEKDILVANPSLMQHSYKATLKGSLAGAVRLSGATKAEFGVFKADFQFKKSFDLVTSELDTNLELVPDRCKPEYVQWTLGKPINEAGRRTWTLSALIPEQQGRRGPLAGSVVVRSTGPNPLTYRFAVTGTGQ